MTENRIAKIDAAILSLLDVTQDTADAELKMTSKFAAIDQGTISGAVYGIGQTSEDAIEDAYYWSQDESAAYRIVPITDEAEEYVRECGGAPSIRLSVSESGVVLLPSVYE